MEERMTNANANASAISVISGIKSSKDGFYFASKTIPMIVCTEMCRKFTEHKHWTCKEDLIELLEKHKEKEVSRDSLNQVISKLNKAEMIESEKRNGRTYYIATELCEDILEVSRSQIINDMAYLSTSLGISDHSDVKQILNLEAA